MNKYQDLQKRYNFSKSFQNLPQIRPNRINKATSLTETTPEKEQKRAQKSKKKAIKHHELFTAKHS
jgi:hypothetical protein